MDNDIYIAELFYTCIVDICTGICYICNICSLLFAYHLGQLTSIFNIGHFILAITSERERETERDRENISVIILQYS